MTVSNSLLYRGLALAFAVSAVYIFAGCQLAEVEQQRQEPVFFPPLPERPRLQFLKSFSGPEDLGAPTSGAFERFVLGDPETQEGIIKPYGMALFDGKLYVCDIGSSTIEVFDLKNRTFGYLTEDRRLVNPVNIFITNDGTKYVADPEAGTVFVFDRNDNLNALLGKGLKIAPIDVTVRRQRCYVTDFNSNQIVVFDRITQKEIARIGIEGAAQPKGRMHELPPGQLLLISDLALDKEGNIYVTDKAAARITQFDSSGKLLRTIGRWGPNIDQFIRPKGIAIDRNDRIWVVDAAPEVAKIYDQQARLLLFFGLPGNKPGMMNLPAKIVLDYDNVELFEQYAVEGAKIEFLVLVSNQYGLNKISVYGFGHFPVQERAVAEAKDLTLGPGSERELAPRAGKGPAQISETPGQAESRPDKRQEEIAELYQRSLALYRSGQYEQAREGFAAVLKSGLIPASMAGTIEGYLADIDNRAARSKQMEEIAETYYSSIKSYRTGQLEEARAGFIKVLNSGLIPPAMEKTIENYLADIDDALTRKQGIQPR
ncbi:MAG: 6-bladed beta-propeller [Planctomycetota bacterium]|jgi:sugar lactone lactonase YvrE